MALKEMEKLKDPAMLLSAINTIAIVGNTAYFYKQMEALRLDMMKISTTLTQVVRKIAEMEKGGQHKDEALHTLNEQIKSFNQRLEEIPSMDSIYDMDTDLDELVAALAERDIDIERPSKAPRRRSGDRRQPMRRRVEEEERRDDSRRSTPRSNGYGSSDRSTREESRPSRNINRETRPSSIRNEPRTEPSINPGNYEDDSDLIDAVRRQQPRN